MTRTAIFAGAVLGLMACGQPDAADDQNGETAVGDTEAGAPIAAQQTLEVDTNAGRQVVGGEEYSFRYAVVDYDRRLILASEAADYLAVTAYSLDDGSVHHVLGGGPAGDGPGELNYLAAIAAGPDGVFAAGRHKVLYWSWSGVLLHQWTPTAPDTRKLCALDGRPAVALQEGVAFRGDDGETVAIGGEARTLLNVPIRSLFRGFRSALDEATNRYVTVQVACADSTAYVLTGYVHSLVEYQRGAEPRAIAMPPQLVEAARQKMESAEWNNSYSNLFLTDDSRLVVTTINTPRVAGALLDRATGCWALLKENPWTSFISYIGMLGDSVVTAERSQEPMTRTVNGRRVSVFYAEDTHIFVRPVRTVAGAPCS